MLTALLPRSHRGRVLALGALLDTVGTGIYLAVATLYFVVYVGIPAKSVRVKPNAPATGTVLRTSHERGAGG